MRNEGEWSLRVPGAKLREMETRVALVTGASSGIGLLAAKRLRERGYRVFGTSRSGDGDGLLRLDVDRGDSVEACARELIARAGRVDVLLNNAGRAAVGACEETTPDEALALFQTNFFGVMRVVASLLPAMRAQGSGRIVNVGSVSGFVAAPFHGVYAATKHALAGYTEALRYEVAPHGIHVSLIEPSAHRTAIQMTQPVSGMALYDAPRRRVEAIIRGQIESGDSPERIVDAIEAAVTSRRPRLRYRVGGKAGLAEFGRRVLSQRLFERLMRREFQLEA